MSERLPARVVFGYAAGSFANALIAIVLTSWIYYFYSPPEDAKTALLLSPWIVGIVRVLERIAGALIEPLVGHFSDRTNSRFGRRIPWIAFGAPILCGSFCAIWFPPGGGADDPLIIAYLGVMLILFWGSYTAVVAPYLALLPELSKTDEGRLRLSTWLAVFEVLATIAGSIGAGILIDAGHIGPIGDGFKLTGIVFGLISLSGFAIVVLSVKEPTVGQVKPVEFSLFRAAAESLKNPEFLPYATGVAGYRLATTSAVIGVPYIATVLMHTDEATAGYMLAIIPVIAVIAFPIVQRLSSVHGKAAIFRAGGIGFVIVLPLMGTIGLVPGVPPMVHGLLLFVLAGFPVATLMVLPRTLLADVIDVDEKRTGYRREAMYNGMAGVVEKAGEAASFGLVGVLFEQLGNSSSEPLGLRLLGAGAACGVLIGLFVFRRYGASK